MTAFSRSLPLQKAQITVSVKEHQVAQSAQILVAGSYLIGSRHEVVSSRKEPGVMISTSNIILHRAHVHTSVKIQAPQKKTYTRFKGIKSICYQFTS